MSKYISCTDTAKLIRTELKKNFPGIKFSVKSSSYAGGASISVRWTDGPARPTVEKVVKVFEGSTFDGSIDLKSYHSSTLNGEEVHFGADSVMCSRTATRAFVEAIVAQFCKQWGYPTSKIKVSGTDQCAYVDAYELGYSENHWFSELLHKTDAKDMYRAYEAEEEREAQERAEWKAGAEERTRQAEADRKEWETQEKVRMDRERVEAEKRAREQQEQARRQQGQRERDAMKLAQRAVLSSKYAALLHLGLSVSANQAEVLNAFRARVKAMADGKGGYNGDMDFLVQVKEKALQ
jgi:hypothetical protein